MSLGNAAFNQASKAQKSVFEKGIGPIIASKRVIRNFTIYSGDMYHQIGVLFLLFLMFSPIVLLIAKADMFENLSDIIMIMLLLLIIVYGISVMMIYGLDLDATECYFRGYKKSVYALATGVTKKELRNNKGLVGEYKSYVLSRSLKIPHRILFNVCIPMPNGNFQEIDAILITRNIIYVLECKNRGGKFVGKIDEKKWMQHIGSQKNETENIYVQNQKHTMALDRFLLDRGIIQNGQNVCINTIFSVGDMSLECDKVPLDFLCGSLKQVRKFIVKNDKYFDDGTDTSGIMERVYETLLPYALYTQAERNAMMQERSIRSQTKEFSIGEFKQKVITGGITGITAPGERAIIRYNKIYTQLMIFNGKNSCWQTRTDIPAEYKR